MKEEWVSCSEIAQACYCPHSLELIKAGHQYALTNQRQMQRGIAAHEQFNERVQTEASDKRCFIASHLYGPEDLRTNYLRRYRDTHLKSRWWGRVLMTSYYRLSPMWVNVCRRIPFMDRLTRLCVDRICDSVIDVQLRSKHRYSL